MVYTGITVTTISPVLFRALNSFKKPAMAEKSRNNKIISAQEIAKAYHITYQAVNYYTDLGLLPVLLKKGNARCYDKGVVDRRLKEIKNLASEGYSLRLIRKKLIGI